MNKKAIVIGGTSGIGKEVVHILVREGWMVGVAGRREGLLQELEEAHRGAYGANECHGFHHDGRRSFPLVP